MAIPSAIARATSKKVVCNAHTISQFCIERAGQPRMSEVKLTWLRFNPSEWMTATMMMSAKERGAYITLVAAIAVTGGRMPDRPQICAGACGLSVQAWKKMRLMFVANGHLEVVDGYLICPLLDIWLNRAPRGPIPVATRRAVFERDGQCCVYCGSSEGPFHLDHVIPVSLGGGASEDNLVVACRSCNLSKGARTAEEWMK